MGKAIRPRADEDYELTSEQVIAAAMAAEGAKTEQIAQAINKSPSTIRMWDKDVGYKREVELRTKESADRMQRLAQNARLGIMDLATEAGERLKAALTALNANNEPNWHVQLKAIELVMKHGVPVQNESDNGGGAKAQSALVVVTSGDLDVAKKMTNGDVIDVEAVE